MADPATGSGTGWDPDGDVLVVGHHIDPVVIGDVRGRLDGTAVHVLDLAEQLPPAAAADDPEPVDESDDLDSGFPAESDRAVELITAELDRHPVTTLLAQSRWGARDVWRVVRPRPDLRGFTHLDNLERAVRQRLDLDVTPFGRRRNSHRFAAEFAGESGLPAWDPGDHVRVLVGPRNAHGVAAGWARALRGTYGIDALSVSVGDEGFPAEIMATSADWATKSVRRQVLQLAESATHVLVDDPANEAAEALAGACPGQVLRAVALPVAVAAGDPPDRDETPMQVLVLSGSVEDVPTTWRVTHLERMPRSLWVAAARSADLLVDHRDPPRLDAVVLNGMAHGAVWVADAAPGRIHRKVPRLASVTDPLLAGETRMRQLRADSARYVHRRHGDEVVARKLRKALGIR